MKFKYFIRGLGSGVILGAMIMLVAYLSSGAYKMSDDEVRARAKRLGMIDDPRLAMATASDGPARTMDDQTTEASKTEEAKAEKKTTTEATTTEATTTEATTTEATTTEATTTEATTTEATTTEKPTTEATTTEKQTTEKQTTEATTTEKQTTEATTTEAATTEKQTTEAATTEEKKDSKDKVKITVTRGMYSEQVSQMLEDAGIVKDAVKFNAFLMEKGYAEKVEVGEFELSPGMSNEEIAKIITTKQ